MNLNFGGIELMSAAVLIEVNTPQKIGIRLNRPNTMRKITSKDFDRKVRFFATCMFNLPYSSYFVTFI